MARHKDTNWNLPDGQQVDYAVAHSALLMDIRDELKRLNGLLHCPNFTDIPFRLDMIRKNTERPPKRRNPRKATKGHKTGKSRS